MTENDFNKKYTYTKVDSKYFDADSQVGMLETFGDDLKKVLEIYQLNIKRVWTMIDDDDGMFLCAGFRITNKIYYVITNEEWGSAEESYLFDPY